MDKNGENDNAILDAMQRDAVQDAIGCEISGILAYVTIIILILGTVGVLWLIGVIR